MRTAPQGLLRGWLAGLPYPAFALVAATVSFAAYFAMYGFRRPFTAATYEGDWAGTAIVFIKAVTYFDIQTPWPI